MENNERDFKGVWIPREIWLDKKLTALDKIILTEIDSLDKGEGCFASNEYISEFCQCSESKVSRAVSKLVELGYITVESFDGRSRILQSCLAKKATLPCKKSKSASQKKQDIKIDTNIVSINNKRPKSGVMDEIIAHYLETEIEEADREEVRDLLDDWLNVRKAKRAANTGKSIELNLRRLKECATGSNLSIPDYLKEVIRRGWAAFFPLTYRKAEKEVKGSLDISDANRRAIEETPIFNKR